MTGLRPEGDLLAIDFADGRRIAARRVVLATGRDGLGGPAMPRLFAGLPASLCAHSSAAIDFASLRGRSVAVIGAGASAFDNAATALEAGAGQVSMIMRRADLPRINKGMGVSSPGLNLGYYDLPPERRIAITEYVAQSGTTPPRASVLRCFRHANFALLAGTPIAAARQAQGRAWLATPRGELGFDFVILGTGFVTDLSRRPELADLAAAVRLWGEAHPRAREHGQDYAACPFLGRHFEFLPRAAGDDWVQRVTCLNFSGTLSHYKLTGDIPAISAGALRLAEGIIRGLFVEDYADHYQRLLDYDTPELLGDEWTQDRAA
jgi:cation diffusion facilitator CzcD-associated flavoprotein CzcO